MTVTYSESSSAPVAPKPRLRGWLHAGMAPVIQLAGLVLLVVTPTLIGRVGVAVYLAAASVLFGTSAFYHRGTWSERVGGLLRRADHANIFVFIAGTYTPLALMLLTGAGRVVLLAAIWTVAVMGVAFKMAWMSAPRWLYTLLYLAMGWAAMAWLPAFWATGGPLVVSLIVLGGVTYSYGAVVYARKLPNPSPTWFGFHEIFHACTIVAAGLHFAAIAIVAL